MSDNPKSLLRPVFVWRESCILWVAFCKAFLVVRNGLLGFLDVYYLYPVFLRQGQKVVVVLSDACDVYREDSKVVNYSIFLGSVGLTCWLVWLGSLTKALIGSGFMFYLRRRFLLAAAVLSSNSRTASAAALCGLTRSLTK